jgi:lipopolysaccharide export system protein LptA
VFARLKRIVGSFAAVVVAYWVYALVAVPFIEPTVAARTNTGPSTDEVNPSRRAVDKQRAQLRDWFHDGDWELTSPKIMETAQGMLLVKDYHNLDNGKVEIHPCTMIFLPEGEFPSEAERRRRAIVLRAPEGAILQFDAFDLTQGKIGKLIGGKLMGPVTIHSDQKVPGPSDDLLIHTREVDLSEQRITTKERIDFALGPNQGKGRNMRIDMAPPAEKQNSFRGIIAFQLTDEVEMRLQPGGSDFFPGSPEARTAPSSSKPSMPVEIRCQGPFNFDFKTYQATFKDRVDVLRLNPVGPSDQLTCDLLSIFFEAKQPPPTPGVAAVADDGGSPKLEPSRIEATGNPVIIRAPSSGVEARGLQVEYDLKTGRAKLSDEREVQLRQGAREIRSRQVEFTPGPKGGVGTFLASGPGWLRGTTPDDATQQFEAHWNRRLHLRPFENNHLLSLEGGAHAQAIGKGSLDAEEIHVWLIEVPVPPVPGQTESSGKKELIPDRMLANGHVRIDSPQLTGTVSQMQTWFEHQPIPALPALPQAASAPAASSAAPASTPAAQVPPTSTAQVPVTPAVPVRGNQPSAAAAPPTAAATPGVGILPAVPVAAQPAVQQAHGGEAGPFATGAKQQFNISGEILRVRVKTTGKTNELSEVRVEHHVRVAETQTDRPGEKPLLILGEQLHLLQPAPDQMVVTVAGRMAYVEARGITLSSEAIHLDRGRNLLWTDSHGVMTFPVDKDLDGKAIAAPKSLNVSWQGRMNFDGRMATFDHEVVARQDPQFMRTELLEVLLSHPVSFGTPKGVEAKSEIDRIFCRRGVYLENRTVEGRTLMSIDRLQAAELEVHQASGNLLARGPGSVTSLRVDSGDKKMQMPGAPSIAKTPAAAPNSKSAPKGLNYLNVQFQRQMTGNMRSKQMLFENQVLTLYGPVPNWESSLDPDHPEAWGERGVMLKSDRLSVVQMPTAKEDEPSYEMEATGNTVVESATYTARSQRVSYAQSKDLLILEGDGRTDARLYRQQRLNGAPSEAIARKILYWPSTNRVEVDDAPYVDLSELPGSSTPK